MPAKSTEPRKALHAYLSDDAHEAWHDRAAEHGVSVSALLESIAQYIADDPASDDFGSGADIIRSARSIDTERRRRNRRR
jgi:hypothetical protein